MVHVSFDRVSDFVPRVPENRCPGENSTIPRICVAPSIEDALNAMPRAGVVMDYMRQLGLPIILHVYHLEGGRVMSSEEIKQYVPDASLSHEMWLLDRPKKTYREDYEILDFTTRTYTDRFWHEMRGIYGIRTQKCRFQSNTENFLNKYADESRKEKLRGIIRENTFRVVLDNIGAELIQRCRKAG
ncbi:MAG: hypothetical protein ACI4FX_05250 [Agathobacter sp.]